MTACLGVILDHNSNTQKFFGGGEVNDERRGEQNDQLMHNDDILGLEMSVDRTTAVTCQRGPKPTCFAWDASTGEKKCRFTLPKGSRGISCISISECGNYMACVDQTNDHNLFVFDLSSGSQVFKQAGDKNKIYDCAFDRKPGSTTLMTAGTKHIKFWETIGESKKNSGIHGDYTMTSHCVGCFDSEGVGYTGAQTGDVYKWVDRQCAGTYKAAKKGFVSAIRAVDGCLYAGGKCGTVTVFSLPDMTATTTVEFDSMVRAIDCMSGAMLVGVRDGSIYHCEGGARKEIMASHHDGEVWGLDVQGS